MTGCRLVTARRKLDQLAKHHHTNTVYMTDDRMHIHLLHLLRKLATPSRPHVSLARGLPGWTNRLLSRGMTGNIPPNHSNNYSVRTGHLIILATPQHCTGVSGPKRMSAPFSAAFVPPGSIRTYIHAYMYM